MANRRLTRVSLLAAICLAACSDPTSVDPLAVFVLRSIGGEPVPATIVLAGQPYTVLADTLLLAAPSQDGTGILKRSFAAAFQPNTPRLVHTEHDFIWRGPAVSVFFDCQVRQVCLAIYSYELGTLSDGTLLFPTHNRFIVERRYERVR